MFDATGPYWLSRDRIRPCSREHAIAARIEARANDPDVKTVDEIEQRAREWRDGRAARSRRSFPVEDT